MLGGAGGWLARQGAFHWDTASAVSLVVSLILSIIAVVLFARRREVQPIITIEDFWGGMAIGFSVAFGGSSVTQRLIGA